MHGEPTELEFISEPFWHASRPSCQLFDTHAFGLKCSHKILLLAYIQAFGQVRGRLCVTTVFWSLHTTLRSFSLHSNTVAQFSICLYQALSCLHSWSWFSFAVFSGCMVDITKLRPIFPSVAVNEFCDLVTPFSFYSPYSTPQIHTWSGTNCNVHKLYHSLFFFFFPPPDMKCFQWHQHQISPSCERLPNKNSKQNNF